MYEFASSVLNKYNKYHRDVLQDIPSLDILPHYNVSYQYASLPQKEYQTATGNMHDIFLFS